MIFRQARHLRRMKMKSFILAECTNQTLNPFVPNPPLLFSDVFRG